MSNAKKPMTDEAAAQRGWKQIEQDSMPASVATEMLCTLRHMGNQERKLLNFSRQRRFQSVLEKKSGTVKLGDRLAGATLVQLGNWNRRSQKKRRGLQHKYESALRLKQQTPLVKRMIAALNLAAARCDLMTELSAQEVEWRMGLTRGEATPKIYGCNSNGKGNLLQTLCDRRMIWSSFGHKTGYPRWVTCN